MTKSGPSLQLPTACAVVVLFMFANCSKIKLPEQGPRVRRVGENISAEQLLEGVFRFIYSLMECAPNLVGRRWQ